MRVAVARSEGTEGLARIARSTRQPQAVAAWCEAVVQAGDWKSALSAYEEGAALVTSELWRGHLLDGAALAASKLGRKDAAKKLDTAWRAAPSLARLLRWLVADDADGAGIRRRAVLALESAPETSSRLVSILQLVIGDFIATAKALADAPGLGWSAEDHPGHIMFPVFAWILANGAPKGVSAAVVEPLLRAPTFAP